MIELKDGYKLSSPEVKQAIDELLQEKSCELAIVLERGEAKTLRNEKTVNVEDLMRGPIKGG
ncbi:hypothetical protein J2Z83_002119 [Virgibacillus natechei]|uniref:Thiamine biosynthesis protein ThiS n=1 Tax=Virgibacillus natechei TaxID=1216297 RepID=A0ABS4II56_9BACI|nr:hypothetical protein [Virgibacillus natechei]MBP1970011.1 hypothetical protein [Virgibacillus natechei]UZD13332.1 hypothetical protein OLD84_01850 [Virgibacillus natechei]